MSEGQEALFRKVEISIFGGSNPYGWLAIAERCFWISHYNPSARMDLVTMRLEEDALSWYNYRHLRKRRMLA